jgi:hypothetical protein
VNEIIDVRMQYLSAALRNNPILRPSWPSAVQT